jgi:hypothetical protein
MSRQHKRKDKERYSGKALIYNINPVFIAGCTIAACYYGN